MTTTYPCCYVASRTCHPQASIVPCRTRYIKVRTQYYEKAAIPKSNVWARGTFEQVEGLTKTPVIEPWGQ